MERNPQEVGVKLLDFSEGVYFNPYDTILFLILQNHSKIGRLIHNEYYLPTPVASFWDNYTSLSSCS